MDMFTYTDNGTLMLIKILKKTDSNMKIFFRTNMKLNKL